MTSYIQACCPDNSVVLGFCLPGNFQKGCCRRAENNPEAQGSQHTMERTLDKGNENPWNILSASFPQSDYLNRIKIHAGIWKTHHSLSSQPDFHRAVTRWATDPLVFALPPFPLNFLFVSLLLPENCSPQ